jgi:hypothetical protein
MNWQGSLDFGGRPKRPKRGLSLLRPTLEVIRHSRIFFGEKCNDLQLNDLGGKFILCNEGTK